MFKTQQALLNRNFINITANCAIVNVASFIFRCLLDWANPGCLGSFEEFDQNFAQPIYLGQRFTATKRELATARKSKIHWLIFLIVTQIVHE